MLIRKPNDIPSSEITPKPAFMNRRTFITGAFATRAALAGGFSLREHLDRDGGFVEADGAKLSGIV